MFQYDASATVLRCRSEAPAAWALRASVCASLWVATVIAASRWTVPGRPGANGFAGLPSRPPAVPRIDLNADTPASCKTPEFSAGESSPCQQASPFAGCVSENAEAIIDDLRSSRPVANLRCGFLDADSQAWLTSVQQRFDGCRYVMHTNSFSYGRLPDTSTVVGDQASVCFAAFVDHHAITALGLPSNATQYARWTLVRTEPAMVAGTIARAAHSMRLMALRLFPGADLSFYMDLKWAVPANPEGLFQQLAPQMRDQSIALAIRWHFGTMNATTGRDVFEEFVNVIQHLYNRRFVQRTPAYVKGIGGADFLDIFRQYIYYHERGYPMHSTGMADAGVLIFNHAHPCATALACMWHNQVAQFSMRLQLSFMYVVQALGMTQSVWMCPQSMNDQPGLFPDANAQIELVPHDWPRFGQFEH